MGKLISEKFAVMTKDCGSLEERSLGFPFRSLSPHPDWEFYGIPLKEKSYIDKEYLTLLGTLPDYIDIVKVRVIVEEIE